MKTYIAGAITGNPNYKDHFDQAAFEVVDLGLVPVVPISLPHNHDKSWSAYMRECIACLVYCDAVYMINNWKSSLGAMIEHRIAQDLGLKIIYQ